MLNDGQIPCQETMHSIFAHGDWLTAEQINARQSTPSADSGQPACDWKRRGLIFSVSIDGKEYFASYQFDSMCRPLPVIQEILDVFGPATDPWKIAAWFHFPNGWISGNGEHESQPVAPMNALDRRKTVIDAARHMHGGYVA
jgi:hypothetical protein